MKRYVRCGWLLWLFCAAALAAPLQDQDVPAPLKPWIAWSLQQDQRPCPLAYGGGEQRVCSWLSSLQLQLDDDGGRFEIEARVYAPGWLDLPGSGERWPQELRVDGAAAPVALRDGRPMVWLASGSHRIGGEWRWSQLPESLYVPASAGLLRLSVNGSVRPYPGRDDRGHVWLGKAAAGNEAGSRHLGLKVFRLIDDDLPARVTTHLDIEAAGEVRDEVIGPVLPAGFIPLTISGSLPARLDDDGRLHVQVRPGVWSVEIVARAPQPLKTLKAADLAAPWPDQEVWSFVAHNELRVVETAGAPAVDPRQTQMPEAWRGYPAFLLQPDAALSFAERQRGSVQTEADQLSLQRQLWLDFDGQGYTLQDQLGGRLNSRWRLDAQAPLLPGRVQVDGEPQLIAASGDRAGVEVRRAALNLSADSRIDGATRTLPVAGWSTDLQNVDTTLHLPPGWRLFATSGADNVPDTWIGRWSLLDLFVVLVASVAALRLFGIGWGLLSLLALALSWHEPGAPRWVWLNLIAAIALARALPDSLKTGALPLWLNRYRGLSAVVVLLVALPFSVQQLRLSLYPQLESHGGTSAYATAPQAEAMVMAEQSMADADSERAMPAAPPSPRMLVKGSAGATRKVYDYAADGGSANVAQQSIQRMDPNVLTQTGPGLPAWNWNAVQLHWSGPVGAEQTFRLWLSPPWLTRLLQVFGVALIFVVLARWLWPSPQPSPASGRGGGHGDSPLPPAGRGAGAEGAALLALIFTVLLLLPQYSRAQEPQNPAAPDTAPSSAPGQDLLAELRRRLLAPPDCLPSCVQIARLAIDVGDETQLTLRLSIDALAASSVPLPLPIATAGAQGRVWQAAQVLVDGQPAPLLRHADGSLHLAVAAGRHEAIVRGSLAGFDQLQLPLPLKPRLVTQSLRGWLLSGVDPQGQAADALQLLRSRSGSSADDASAASEQALPALLIVTRTLHLGLDWDVDTVVRREGVTHTPVLSAVPLFKGEQITGEGVRVEAGQVQLSLAPGQTETRWSSRLPISPSLQLQAPQRNDAVEIWQFDISPLWHVEFDGLPPISRQQNDSWLPRYQPWPGESLSLQITRPAGVQGQTLTLDATELRAQPSQRASDYELSLRLRASQGGQHALALPPELKLRQLLIDGQPQPARQEGGKLLLPLHPGVQTIQLSLRSEQGLGSRVLTPALDLGLSGVNARLAITLPDDRWILLLGGPRLGPAVLFWGVLAVLLIVAGGLARLRLAPLKIWHWALLMVGLSQVPVWAAAVVAGWLLALGARGRYSAQAAASRRRFNALQLGLVALTLFALGLLFTAVAQGLLGAPDMQIAGNESYGNSLQWFQDRWSGTLPQAWVISVPLWVYRVLMLLWALWLANALLHWLRWGWTQFTSGGLWQKPEPKPAEPPMA